MAKAIEVLFIDDDRNTLDIINNLFLPEPFGVATTTSIDHAMEILKTQKLKVVVSDQVMPKIQGIQLLLNVKQFDANIVRILLTAYTDFSAAEEAINNV